jgi:tryptophan synthase alpha chain
VISLGGRERLVYTQCMTSRITTIFAQKRPVFIPFLMAGDPDIGTSQEFLNRLPEAGADIIEIGVPFSDPAADGPVIEAAGLRALANHTTLAKVLAMVAAFRETNTTTPIVLMGYYNPIYRYGIKQFALDAAAVGVDGLIIVDLPPEEEAELTVHLKHIDLIRLIAPTTPTQRQQYITSHASGFVYYISVKGITGGQAAEAGDLKSAIDNIKQYTSLPVAAGFGIKTPSQAAAAAKLADAVVVGSALVQCLHEQGITAALKLAEELADAVHQ